MTQLIYLEDNYIYDFETVIVRVNVVDNTVELRETAFHPQGGHQICDTGNISIQDLVLNVVDVKKRGDMVVHSISDRQDLASLKEGMVVKCSVDSSKRYETMKTHTAQHLLSAIAQQEFDLDSIDMAIGKGEGSIKFDGLICIDDAMRMQDIANMKIMLGKSVSRVLVDGRYWVSIDGIDIRQCGCTHVHNIAEIGSVYIHKIEKNKAYFMIGDLANQQIQLHQREMMKLCTQMGTDIGAICDYVTTLESKSKNLAYSLTIAATELLKLQLHSERRTLPCVAAPLAIAKRTELEIGEIRAIVLEHLKVNTSVIIVIGAKCTALAFSNAPDLPANRITDIFKTTDNSFRGGGNKSYSQGGAWTRSTDETYKLIEAAMLEVTAFCD